MHSCSLVRPFVVHIQDGRSLRQILVLDMHCCTPFLACYCVYPRHPSIATGFSSEICTAAGRFCLLVCISTTGVRFRRFLVLDMHRHAPICAAGVRIRDGRSLRQILVLDMHGCGPFWLAIVYISDGNVLLWTPRLGYAQLRLYLSCCCAYPRHGGPVTTRGCPVR